jgi:hypothetical protein
MGTSWMRLNYLQGPKTNLWDEITAKALDAFTSTENLEERVDLVARTVDAPALAYLRRTFG